MGISPMEASEGRSHGRVARGGSPRFEERHTMGTQAETITALGSLIAGIQKHPPPGVLLIEGKIYTTAALVQDLQAIIDPLNATVSARAAYLEATKNSDAVMSDNQSFIVGLRQMLQLMNGQSPLILSDFGLSPRKKVILTPAQKTLKAAKAKATRLARGTKGKKQAAAIKGNVTGVTITPTTAPTAATPATHS